MSNDIDDYQLQEELGKGGFSTVYRAIQKSTGQTVALKLLKMDELFSRSNNRSAERFERETQLCAELNHPNIVKLLDKGKSKNGQFFAVFEFVKGETLKDKLLRVGSLTAVETGELMGQVLDALACAHNQGVVHRDLKPQNIMITSTGIKQHVKVLDFGIGAFIPEARKLDYKSLTLTQESVGTPSYSAPEQLRGEPPTIKSDIYTWGLLVLECLTGKPVMQGKTMAETFYKQLSPADVPLPSAIVNHPISVLLRRALSKNPSQRPEKAEQLYNEFREINLHNIVGKIQGIDYGVHSNIPDDNSFESLTVEESVVHPDVQSERRQVTVLCCSLDVTSIDSSDVNMEALEALQRDLLGMCVNISAGFGGYHMGTLGDCILVYFGYPNASDNDARRAARTALELAVQIRHRSALLESQQGIRLEITMGIHTDLVVLRQNCIPVGIVPSTALKLVHIAEPETVLVSESTHKLLENYIDFKPFGLKKLGGTQAPILTYMLKGERQTEAISFLPQSRINYKLVGRTKELSNFADWWRNTINDSGGAVLVEGEAGIGKSRLMYEMSKYVQVNGYTSFGCRCLPEHTNNALFPVFDMLKKRIFFIDQYDGKNYIDRITAVLRACELDYKILLPIFCSWLSLPLPQNVDPIQHSPDKQKQLLIDAIITILLKLDNDPALIIIEDIHWIDATTSDFIAQLLSHVDKTRFLLLVTTRPCAEISCLELFEEKVYLQKLSAGEIEKLISEILGGAPVNKACLSRIIERTDGIPLFIEEFTKMLIDNKKMVKVNDEYVLTDNENFSSIPLTLRELLNNRLASLQSARETAQIAATIGREFNYELLETVSLRDEALIQADLEKMLAADLIFQQRRVEGEKYIFRHALIRDAAYESMLNPNRRSVHARIAEVLEQRFKESSDNSPGEIATHFAEAGQYEKAVSYGIKAVRTSLERSSNHETIVNCKYVQKWLKNLDSELQPTIELENNGLLTQAMMAKYGWADEQVKAVIDRSTQLLDELDSDNLKIPTMWSLLLYHHVAGDRAIVRTLMNDFLRITKSVKDTGLEIVAAAMNGLSHHADGNYEEAGSVLHFAVENYDERVHGRHAFQFGFDTYAWAAAALGLVQWFQDKTDSAISNGDRAVQRARELNHIPSIGIALLYRSMVHQYAGEKKLAANLTGELLQLCDKYGLPAYAGYAAIIHAWAIGNNDTIEQVVNGLKHMGCNLALTYYSSLSAELSVQSGDYEHAIHCLDNCIAMCNKNNEWLYYPELLRLKSEYLLISKPENSDEAREVLLQSMEHADRMCMVRTKLLAMKTYSQNFKHEICPVDS